ncbi:MAG: HAD family hydrolase [Planctomycetota bacterium]
MRTWLLIAIASCCLAGFTTGCTTARLDSWNDTQPREDIADFVARVSTSGSPDYVPPSERIAVFDNDGTLWAEQPAYFQLLFAMDRVRAMAPEHPEWRRTQPFKAVLEGDKDALIASGKKGLLEIVATTHTGMTTAEFDETVRTWITTARHPDTGQLYSDMIYAPMLELLEYLRANGFKTFIVSGGGIDFMRVFAEEVYGIPPEQIIGSSIKTEFAMTPDGPVIRRLPEINFIDDKEGKPVGIHMHIGRRPILAGGNSDGDHQMLQWTAAGDGPSLCLLVHHTDAQREWAYDRDSHIGRLDAALDQARADGWTIIDMKNDWSRVFVWEQ